MGFQSGTLRRLTALLTSVIAVSLICVPAASASIKFVTQWGGFGQGPGQFGGPVDLSATSSGTVFVSDIFNNQIPRIQRFSRNGAFELEWTAAGGNGQFLSPGGIATSPSGDIYVGDYALNRIQRFDSDLNFLGGWGTSGSGKGQFASPWGVATDRQGRVYVVDFGNSRIEKFSPSGKYLDQWGSFGSGKGEFRAPSFVATDSSGHVYVADSGNSRIQKFNSNGKFLGRWGSPGPGAGVPDYPLGVATDPEGDVYVVGTNSVQKYDPSGVMLTRWGEYGKGKGQFRNPQGIATDSHGNVYVGDSGNDRVQKFHDSGPPYPDPGTARLRLRSTRSIGVRGGRSVTLVTKVDNTGSNEVRNVRVCVPRSPGATRSIRWIPCRELGTIAVGDRKVTRFRVTTNCVDARAVTLGVRAGASNATAVGDRTRVRITNCRPSPGTDPNQHWEGLG